MATCVGLKPASKKGNNYTKIIGGQFEINVTPQPCA